MRNLATAYTCEICEKEFYNQIALIKHVSLRHPPSKETSTLQNISVGTSKVDPLSINEEEFLENFNKQLMFKGFTESLLSTVRNFNLLDCRRMYKDVGNLNIPTFVAWGKIDGIVPYNSSKNLKECIPHS